MKAEIFNNKNEKSGSIELSDKIFCAKWNSDLVHQAVQAILFNRREPIAHAKGRGEVSGGGKKPWRQKGTGRARHGSIRSPLWAGGGVTHGPTKEKVYSKKINKKMNQRAIFSALSKKIKDSELKIIDNFNIENFSKTKEAVNALKNIVKFNTRTLLISADKNKKINRLFANVSKINSISPKSLNVYDLLNCKNIIIEEEAIKEIEKYYKL